MSLLNRVVILGIPYGNAYMSLLPMDSIFAISLGFALRLVVDAASYHNNRIGSSLIGLWEGAVLYHFIEKWPTSVDPYVGLGFRLLVDFLFTESLIRIAIILLWTVLGFIISDVTPAFWYDKNLHRFYRRTRRFIRDFDWNSLKIPLPAAAISRVRFYEAPSFGPPESTSLAPSSQRRHSVPGNFPGYSSASTDASLPPFSTLRRPVPATSLPPSALRPAGRPPKPSSTSSVSFDVVPPSSEIPPIDDDLYDDGDYDQPPQSPPPSPPPPREEPQLWGQRTPTPKPVPPPIIAMPVPEFTRTHSGEDTSPTLLPTANTDKPPPIVVVAPDLIRTSSLGPPTNIDALPEIIEPRDDDDDPNNANADNPVPDPDPPPPFEARGGPPPPPAATDAAAAPLRDWGKEKLAVRNPEVSDRASVRSSIASGGNRDSIIVRADLLREQAHAEEKERDRLHAEQKRAFSDKRYAEAIKFKVDQEEANERAMNLHRRAAERYFKGTFFPYPPTPPPLV